MSNITILVLVISFILLISFLIYNLKSAKTYYSIKIKRQCINHPLFVTICEDGVETDSFEVEHTSIELTVTENSAIYLDWVDSNGKEHNEFIIANRSREIVC